jgi:hypothetical protein
MFMFRGMSILEIGAGKRVTINLLSEGLALDLNSFCQKATVMYTLTILTKQNLMWNKQLGHRLCEAHV